MSMNACPIPAKIMPRVLMMSMVICVNAFKDLEVSKIISYTFKIDQKSEKSDSRKVP